VPEEMSQILPTNKKKNKGKNTMNTPLTSLSPASYPFTGRNKFVFVNEKSGKPLKIFLKTSRGSYLGRDQSIHVNKSHAHQMT
jgi:hypothetical protein